MQGDWEIVDSHTHLGNCSVFDLNVTEAQLLQAMNSRGIRASLVMPFPGARDPAAIHDQIAELSRRYPGRLFGVCSLSPHVGDKRYRAEARRCVVELGFVALKLHTIGHAVSPGSRAGSLVWETAAELGVPVIVHTGPGIPFSLPSLCIPQARRFPNVPVVLAHGGFNLLSAEAIVVAKECPNVYIETSWLTVNWVTRAIQALGPERVMFGSDGPENVRPGLEVIQALSLPDTHLRHVLQETATRVFSLNRTEWHNANLK